MLPRTIGGLNRLGGTQITRRKKRLEPAIRDERESEEDEDELGLNEFDDGYSDDDLTDYNEEFYS